LVKVDNSNNQTLEDLKRLQKIFSKNPNLCVWDLQGLVAEDGQLYIIDPQNVDMQNSKHNSIQLDGHRYIYKCDFFITPRCFYAKRF
jgi:hypothetical protein